jgi:hypothetical protein
MARIELNEIVTGLGLLGNVLSLPRQVQAQQIGNEQTRALLEGSGLPPELIKTATPEPMLRWLSPQQGGFTGKVLGGVGDVGSILSTVVGKPVKAPRMELSDLAAASKLRSGHAEELAKRRLGDVIMDPKSTPRDIAAASIAAGNTSDALRLLRPGGERPPASVLGLRSAIESMGPDDPRRPAYQRALDDQLAYQREQDELANRRITERQPPHYDPAETERMRHEQIMKNRAADAAERGYKPGTSEYEYYMAYGHPRVERAPKAEKTLDEYIEDENRRRTALARDPRTKKEIPDEPVETTARRNMENARKAATEQKAGAPVPPPPSPKPRGRPGAAGGAAIGGALGGGSETPPPPPAAKTGDEQAIAVLKNIDFDALPPEIKQQVLDASAAGMPKQELANWLLSLQPPQQ